MKSEKLLFTILITAYTIFLLFIDQRRRELLIVIFMCIVYYIYIYEKKNNFRQYKEMIKKVFISFLLLFIVFISYQYCRNFFHQAYTNGITNTMQSMQNIEKNDQYYYDNELGLVYATNLASVKYRPELFYGKSYLEALLRPIPVISNIIKVWFNMGDQDSVNKWLSQIYTTWFDEGGGLGFSPSSEAYINFGSLGCIILGFLIGFFLNLLYYKFYNDKGLCIYCILYSLAFVFSRTSFYGFTSEAFWMIIYYYFYESIFNIITINKRYSIYI